jgi:hypothetical protein
MTLVSSVALKAPDVEGMVWMVEEVGAVRYNSFSSTTVTVAVTSSMLPYYSQSNARWALASTVLIPTGPDILSLR